MKTKYLMLAALFAALTAVGAFVRIPLPVASVTLQMLMTLLAGLLLGPRWGAVSQGVYVALGLLGLPIFTMGGGFGYVLQPTFGFLLGLIPAAAVTGLLAPRWGRFRACLAGTGAMYLVGLPYLHGVMTLVTAVDWSWGQTLVTGMLLFLPADVAKAALAAWLAGRMRYAVR